jgi:type II secretory pathway pseudopilin PulG
VAGSARSRRAGFTLLEVIVALAIAIPAMILLLRAGSDALTAAQVSGRYENAIARARSHLAALTDTALAPGEQAGDDGDGFAWRTVITRLAATPPPARPPRNPLYAAGTSLYAITVEVSWPSRWGRRTFSLASRRLAPSRLDGR